MHEVDVGPLGLEHVDGPPAVGGFDGHVGIGPGLGQGHGQGDGVVLDAHDADLLAGFVLPHDQGAAGVQVDGPVLFFHGSSLSGSGVLGDRVFRSDRSERERTRPSSASCVPPRRPPARGCRSVLSRSVSESAPTALSCHHVPISPSGRDGSPPPCLRPVRQAESRRGICSECLDSLIIERGPTVNHARIDQLLPGPRRHNRSEVHVALVVVPPTTTGR
jgi:hypothetical protein